MKASSDATMFGGNSLNSVNSLSFFANLMPATGSLTTSHDSSLSTQCCEGLSYSCFSGGRLPSLEMPPSTGSSKDDIEKIFSNLLSSNTGSAEWRLSSSFNSITTAAATANNKIRDSQHQGSNYVQWQKKKDFWHDTYMGQFEGASSNATPQSCFGKKQGHGAKPPPTTAVPALSLSISSQSEANQRVPTNPAKPLPSTEALLTVPGPSPSQSEAARIDDPTNIIEHPPATELPVVSEPTSWRIGTIKRDPRNIKAPTTAAALEVSESCASRNEATKLRRDRPVTGECIPPHLLSPPTIFVPPRSKPVPSTTKVHKSTEHKSAASVSPRKATPKRKRKVTPECKEYIVGDYKPSDVLFGRGGRSNHWVGNKEYLELVNEKKPLYRKSDDKKVKQQMIEDILRTVWDKNGRFLELDQTEKRWYISHPKQAYSKIGQALRDQNDKESRQKKREKYGPAPKRKKKRGS